MEAFLGFVAVILGFAWGLWRPPQRFDRPPNQWQR